MAISKNSAVFTKCGDTIDYTPAADVAAGTIVKVGGLYCLATSPVAANALGAVKCLKRGEVITVTADDAIGAAAAGTAIYMNASNLVTLTATNNTLVGYARAAITATDKTFEMICA